MRHLHLFLLLIAAGARADGPADNLADKVRRMPPPGIVVPAAVRAELIEGVKSLGEDIAKIRSEFGTRTDRLRLLPDVEIFHKAVDWALRYDEFFNTNQFKSARALLLEGHARAAALRAGHAPWLTATGAVVRGYLSRIDGSVQPYGLVIPPGVSATGRKPSRLDIWFHGRGETLSELDFIQQRNNPKNLGEFAPPNAIVLHPYGRYCNGSRFAGETDTFEAMEWLQHDYPVDQNRIVVRGFSLGGASAWHFASHHAGRWAAVAPGAGFSETADFLKVFQNEKLAPPWWEQKLWRLHDSPDWVENFRHLPTVAYSGEIDRQKQAADVMATAFEKAGMKLTHIIGPQTAHKYHPDAKKQINELIDGFAEKGRDPMPKKVSFVTYTTRYHRMHWVQVDGLERHWEQASVQGEIEKGQIAVRTKNVSALTLNSGSDLPVVLDGEKLPASVIVNKLHQPTRSYRKTNSQWQETSSFLSRPAPLAKHHGLQGPIDDAFMDSFLIVKPTGKPVSEKTGAWVQAEMARAITQWRAQFRGEPRVKNDTEVTDADLKEHNLILWGDPWSNLLLRRLHDDLPVRWKQTTEPYRPVTVGPQFFDSASHVPVLIYPNPLNPKKYIVLNSGFTFREYDYLNNARQTPKLPDYAIIDVMQSATSRVPGGVVAAGFFGERWELLPPPVQP